MIYATGTKTAQGYKMHAPTFPYASTVYIGYTLAEMKRKYRRDHGLVGRHIEWVMLGV